MNEPLTILDALILIAVYLVASLAHKAICSMLAARDVLRETGDEAAPERPDDASAEPTRAVCTPAASSLQDCESPTCPFRRMPHQHLYVGGKR